MVEGVEGCTFRTQDVEPPSISDFEPTDAIHAWNVTGHRSRRPNYQTSSCSSSIVGHARVSDSESQGSSSDEGQ